MAIRSGRFKVADASGTNAVEIIRGHSGAFYRVLNSGDNPFTLKTTGGGGSSTDKTVSLEPTYSVDFSTKDTVTVEGAAGEPIEGIYEYLDGINSARSGRFKFREQRDSMGNPVDIPAYPHLVITLKGSNDKAFYRFFNSGSNAIDILEDGAKIKSLASDQSYDVEVGTSVHKIEVDSADRKLPIEGIYEFLGRQ